MDKLFRNKWAIRVISLVLAITMYLFVNIETNSEQNNSRVDQNGTTETEVLEDVELDLRIDAENYVVSGVPEHVSVTLEGKRSVLAPIVRLRNFTVFVDLEDYEEGEHTVELEYEGLPDNVAAYIEPKEINVEIEERATREFNVDIDIVKLDELPTGYELGEPELTPETVTVIGSEASMDQIAMVKVFVDVTDLKESIRNRELPISVYDAQGNDLSVRVEPATVNISIPVERPSKTVPLSVATTGELSDNLEVKEMDVVSEIEIFGKRDQLSEVEEISTEELDLSTIEESGTFEVGLDLPEGVVANDEQVEVEVEVEASKTFKKLSIEIKGQDEEDVTFVEPKEAEVDISVTGNDELVHDLKKEDVNALIDLSGLSEGEHEVDIDLEGPEDLTLEPEIKKAKVEIQ